MSILFKSIRTIFFLLLVGPLCSIALADDAQLIRFYANFDTKLRIELQRALIWSDDYVGIADGNISPRTISAIRNFQAKNSGAPTGWLTKLEINRLFQNAQNSENNFGYRLYHDQATGASIGIPANILSGQSAVKRGTRFTSRDSNVDMVTMRIPLAERSLEEFYRQSISKSNRVVDYSVLRGDWFVVNGTENGKNFYIRAHSFGGDIRGFAISYSSQLQPALGRLTTMMSGDFRADSRSTSVAEGRANWGLVQEKFASIPFTPDPRESSAPPVETPRNRQAEPKPAALSDATGGPFAPLKERVSSGTAFLVSDQGHLLTNAHVVTDCKTVSVGSFGFVQIVDIDKTNDLALLKTDIKISARPLPLAETSPLLGEEVIALGFPLQDILQNGLNATRGDISSLAGLGGDSRFLQITAAVQPGNSGGPLLDREGRVVGIVTQKLNAVKMAAATGDIPQSVNFAIRSELSEIYLKRFAVPHQTVKSVGTPRPMTEVISTAQPAIFVALCVH